jgi:hypothetical protein
VHASDVAFFLAYRTVSGVNGPLVILDNVKVILLLCAHVEGFHCACSKHLYGIDCNSSVTPWASLASQPPLILSTELPPHEERVYVWRHSLHDFSSLILILRTTYTAVFADPSNLLSHEAPCLWSHVTAAICMYCQKIALQTLFLRGGYAIHSALWGWLARPPLGHIVVY